MCQWIVFASKLRSALLGSSNRFFSSAIRFVLTQDKRHQCVQRDVHKATAERAEQCRYLRFFPLIEADFADGSSDGCQRDQTQTTQWEEGRVQKNGAAADHILLNLQQGHPKTTFKRNFKKSVCIIWHHYEHGKKLTLTCLNTCLSTKIGKKVEAYGRRRKKWRNKWRKILLWIEVYNPLPAEKNESAMSMKAEMQLKAKEQP